LKAAQDALATKQASLKKVKDFVAGLERTYNEKQRFLESLNTQKETTMIQLERADKLVNGLADESQRWIESEAKLGVELINLIGNIMVSAGFVSYVGPFTADYRNSLLKGWMEFAKE
jgi:dynein heavy chain